MAIFEIAGVTLLLTIALGSIIVLFLIAHDEINALRRNRK